MNGSCWKCQEQPRNAVNSQCAMDSFEWGQSPLTAYLDIRQPEHLFASTFAILTSDLNFGSWDPNRDSTMFGSIWMHCPVQRRSAVSSAPALHCPGKMVLSGFRALDYWMPWTKSILPMPFAVPAIKQKVFKTIRRLSTKSHSFRVAHTKRWANLWFVPKSASCHAFALQINWQWRIVTDRNNYTNTLKSLPFGFVWIAFGTRISFREWPN